MTLRELPLGALHALAIVLYMGTLAAVYSAIRASGHRACRKTFLFSMLAAAVNFMPASGLGRCFIQFTRHETLLPVMERFISLPLWAVIGPAAVMLTVNVLLFIRMERRIRRELSAQSVCEGLDQLPDGVSYSLPDGFPKLVNSRMQAISNAAFGVGVSDTRRLDERLQSRDLLPGCTLDKEANNTFLRSGSPPVNL